MRIKSVIFDFDYTLVDSSLGVMECISYALKEMNMPIPPTEVILKTVGLSLSETFRSLSGQDGENDVAEFSRLFVEQADRTMLERMVLFDTAKPTLEGLLKNGLNLGIVSTKFRYRIEAFLQREKLEHAFDVIVGGEDVFQHKPDPAGLLAAISRLERTPDEVVFVGDSTTDAETARRAHTPFVAVLSGVTPKEDFNSYSPLAIIGDLSSLLVAVTV